MFEELWPGQGNMGGFPRGDGELRSERKVEVQEGGDDFKEMTEYAKALWWKGPWYEWGNMSRPLWLGVEGNGYERAFFLESHKCFCHNLKWSD